MTSAQKRLLNKWLKTLRSGKYKQTKNRLRNGNSFCCLGVLCDIVPKNYNGSWDRQFGRFRFVMREGNEEVDDSVGECLPDGVVNGLGLSDHSGKFQVDEPFLARLQKKDKETAKKFMRVHKRYKTQAGAYHDNYICLTDLNDSGMTFKQIADVIACKPKGLFAE